MSGTDHKLSDLVGLNIGGYQLGDTNPQKIPSINHTEMQLVLSYAILQELKKLNKALESQQYSLFELARQ